MTGAATLEIHPLTPDRWPDLAALFGPTGASSGCWCMWFRARPKDWTANAGDGNRAALKALVDGGEPTGLLGYQDGDPVGWVSVAPRAQHVRIEPAPVADPDGPVWSVACFYIARGRRGVGVARALLDAAVAHAFAEGAGAVEAYPVEGRASNASAFTGPRALLEAAGFREMGRFERWAAAPEAGAGRGVALARSSGRPVLRRTP
jgi:ribosomal protein S18 acetylase RimI-like enzyme